MLDTNMASYVIKGQPLEVRKQLVTTPSDSVVISSVTQGELLYGLARKGDPTTLANLIREFLLRVKILSWDTQAATTYGRLRASYSSAGITIGALDMMIAAHAAATNAVLVTHDKAFSMIPNGILSIEDWTVPGQSNPH